MEEYYLTIEVNVKQVDEIFKKLEVAKRKICECYDRLDALGVIRLKETDNEDSQKE